MLGCAGHTHCWVNLNDGDKILATLVMLDPQSDDETASHASTSSELPNFEMPGDTEDEDVESDNASLAPSLAPSSSLGPAPSMAGSVLEMFNSTVRNPLTKAAGVWSEENEVDAEATWEDLVERPERDRNISDEAKLQADIAVAMVTQEMTRKHAMTMKHVRITEEQEAKAKGKRLLNIQWMSTPPPAGPPPKAPKSSCESGSKEFAIPKPPTRKPPPPPTVKKAAVTTVPPPPPAPIRNAAGEHVKAPSAATAEAKAKQARLIRPTWEIKQAKAKREALLTATWKQNLGVRHESDRENVSETPAEETSTREMPADLSPKTAVTPDEVNPFDDITANFLEQLDEEDAAMADSPRSEASCSLLGVKRSRQEDRGNKIKLEPDASPVPCTPTSPAEIVSESFPDGFILPVVTPGMIKAKEELSNEFECSDGDAHMVREIMMPYMELHSCFVPTPENIPILRCAYDAKTTFSGCLYKLAIGGGTKADVLEEMRGVRTSVVTALWAMSAQEPAPSEGYCATAPAVDDESQKELIRVLSLVLADLELAIETNTPPETASPNTTLDSIPEDGTVEERPERVRDAEAPEQQHLPRTFNDPRHRDDPKLTAEESELVADADRAKAKEAGVDGAAVWTEF